MKQNKEDCHGKSKSRTGFKEFMKILKKREYTDRDIWFIALGSFMATLVLKLALIIGINL